MVGGEELPLDLGTMTVELCVLPLGYVPLGDGGRVSPKPGKLRSLFAGGSPQLRRKNQQGKKEHSPVAAEAMASIASQVSLLQYAAWIWKAECDKLLFPAVKMYSCHGDFGNDLTII